LKALSASVALSDPAAIEREFFALEVIGLL
jgi:hypothetical protein